MPKLIEKYDYSEKELHDNFNLYRDDIIYIKECISKYSEFVKIISIRDNIYEYENFEDYLENSSKKSTTLVIKVSFLDYSSVSLHINRENKIFLPISYNKLTLKGGGYARIVGGLINERIKLISHWWLSIYFIPIIFNILFLIFYNKIINVYKIKYFENHIVVAILFSMIIGIIFSPIPVILKHKTPIINISEKREDINVLGKPISELKYDIFKIVIGLICGVVVSRFFGK